jgi:sugar phosphate isomerase/epimerase
MNLSICSYSFHRTCAAGGMDIFSFIQFCKDFGCSHLDPWNAHLSLATSGKEALHAGHNPAQSHLEPPDAEHLAAVKKAAAAVGLPFGCIAVDGGHIYDADPKVVAENRRRRLAWIDVAGQLGAESVRVDAGGPEDMPEPIFREIVAGYREAIDYARECKLQVLIENHWGPSQQPENVVKLLDTIDGLGLLFDTNNWARYKQALGWRLCAPYAKATHVKAIYWAADGEEFSQHIGHAIQLLQKAGYQGTWGIESCPQEVDEYEGVKRSKALIQKYVVA